MSDVEVRPYRPEDREAVRHICFVTGYIGEPVEWQWADEASFADLFTSWYTDHEPESAFVAERDGRVVGYLLGCRDTGRMGNPGAPLRRHLLPRGLLFKPGTAPVLWRGLYDAVVDGARNRLPDDPFLDDRWPAHLHIDLRREARGQGVGARLMGRWLDVLREHEVPGCHLGTMAENTPAIAFFEAQGFRKHGPYKPVPGLRTPRKARLHSQLMVQDLAG